MLNDTRLTTLCAVAGPIAAAHPDWTPADVAEHAEAIVRACEARCPAPAVTRNVVYVGDGDSGTGLPEALREMIAREFDAAVDRDPGAA